MSIYYYACDCCLLFLSVFVCGRLCVCVVVLLFDCFFVVWRFFTNVRLFALFTCVFGCRVVRAVCLLVLPAFVFCVFCCFCWLCDFCVLCVCSLVVLHVLLCVSFRLYCCSYFCSHDTFVRSFVCFLCLSRCVFFSVVCLCLFMSMCVYACDCCLLCLGVFVFACLYVC